MNILVTLANDQLGTCPRHWSFPPIRHQPSVLSALHLSFMHQLIFESGSLFLMEFLHQHCMCDTHIAVVIWDLSLPVLPRWRHLVSPVCCLRCQGDYVPFVSYTPTTSRFRASSEPKKVLPSTYLAVRQAKSSLNRIEVNSLFCIMLMWLRHSYYVSWLVDL